MTFIQSLDDLIVQDMGCMYDQEESKICQNQSQCSMKFTNAENKFLHCCCDRDLCNSNINLSNPSFVQDKLKSNEETDRTTRNCSSAWFCRYSSMVVIVSIAVFLLIPLIVVLLIVVRRNLMKRFCFRLMKKKQRDNAVDDEKQAEQSSLINAEPLNKSIDPKQIEIGSEIIKTGRFSTVRRGLFDGHRVAVKLFEIDSNDKTALTRKMFEHERDIYLLNQMEHEHILKFFGHSMVGLNYCLIVDLVDQGSLRDFLRSNRIDDEQDLIRMLKEISGAVEFLHRDFRAGGSTSRSSIAHRDIKSENILRYSNGTLVLCDFAMSIQIDEIQMSTFDHQQVGTVRYMSPEILSGTISNDFNALLRCDVYSLGLVFWEIVSRYSKLEGTEQYEMPFESQLTERKFHRNPTIEEMLEIVNLDPPLNRPLIRASWRNQPRVNEIILTIEQCWHYLSEGRINSSLVAHRIRQIQ